MSNAVDSDAIVRRYAEQTVQDAPTTAELAALSDEQIAEVADTFCDRVYEGNIEFWRGELACRRQERATDAMLGLTRQMRTMTIFILICTIANAAIAGALLWIALK